MMHDSDEELVIRIQSGEVRAFETLHRRYYPKIYRLALIKTGHSEDAKDIAGETFCRALLHLGSFRFQGCQSIYPWLHRIACNLVVDLCRARMPSRSVSLESETAEGVRGYLESLRDEGPSPQELVERKEVQALVRIAIAKLPADQADAVAFRFLGELSINEIACAMNRSEGAVKSLIHRALVSLRANLQETAGSNRSQEKAFRRGRVTDDAGSTIQIHRRTL